MSVKIPSLALFVAKKPCFPGHEQCVNLGLKRSRLLSIFQTMLVCRSVARPSNQGQPVGVVRVLQRYGLRGYWVRARSVVFTPRKISVSAVKLHFAQQR
jgi:hypothetical protein